MHIPSLGGSARHNVHNFDKAGQGRKLMAQASYSQRQALFLGNHGVAVFHSRLQVIMVIRRSNNTKKRSK